ncbi:hypothetical protein ASE04_05150 [Rhizobium sp. Root708]|uniref:hypothetical protein n=1 Tax=Rhizobium sp. Root708 TaxID=1736592 RepID=UPI0006F6328C|nr:hypothetical protein [Rhizobium sp. Root708]KRB55104.1 hypothetical protein ASE04_05150 [Rhizobium sp. Root708]
MFLRPSLLFLSFALAPSAAWAEEELSARDKRCLDMRLRFERAERQNPERGGQEIEKLRLLGIDLCSKGKQAQGIRAFASAVEILEE